MRLFIDLGNMASIEAMQNRKYRFWRVGYAYYFSRYYVGKTELLVCNVTWREYEF